ncbi:MAG: discoidin domain-containing protein, partial [Lachnospiraceae bacterium]|nr:discoidin domain-containing protein [Lachnospiraceae bacterium]
RVEDVEAGKAIVKVVMHTRDYETAGVSKAVNVKGEVEVSTEFDDSVIPTFKNLAVGKNVTVSSVENDSLSGQYAVDNDPNTRWSSAWNDGEWIMVDLGKVHRLDAVVIDWEAAYASKYQIYSSIDGVEWGATNAGTANGAGEVVSRANITARYIKVVCQERGTQYGSSIYELKVFGY